MSMCLPSSRSLVAPDRGLGGLPLAAPWWRSLIGSALSAGACRWRLRASARAFSGAVLVAGFGCPAAAARFAASWGWWCGCSLGVRRFAGRGGPVWGCVGAGVRAARCALPGRSAALEVARAGVGGARLVGRAALSGRCRGGGRLAPAAAGGLEARDPGRPRARGGWVLARGRVLDRRYSYAGSVTTDWA
jgi:hypothetical protein